MYLKSSCRICHPDVSYQLLEDFTETNRATEILNINWKEDEFFWFWPHQNDADVI